MAGIYIHIPFCRKACSYCNFHFSTNLDSQNGLVKAIIKEIDLQKKSLAGDIISTIYFGGGTPSLLPVSDLENILSRIHQYFKIDDDPEITIEANPDDIATTWLRDVKGLGISRLSLGVQSFQDEDLKYLGRIHDSHQAKEAVKLCLDQGFNLTVDLIYGMPTLNTKAWENNLTTLFEYGVSHLSCYSLIIEEGTLLDNQINKGKIKPLQESLAAEHFEIVTELTDKHGYEQYEICNFALKGKLAKHNTNYWKGIPYLGLGPSAHSYFIVDDDPVKYVRQWNVSNNASYIKALEQGNIPFEREILNLEQRFNEYIMTGLRTIWGCDIKYIEETFSEEFSKFFKDQAIDMIEKKLMIENAGIYTLSFEGKLAGDTLISELFS